MNTDYKFYYQGQEITSDEQLQMLMQNDNLVAKVHIKSRSIKTRRGKKTVEKQIEYIEIIEKEKE